MIFDNQNINDKVFDTLEFFSGDVISGTHFYNCGFNEVCLENMFFDDCTFTGCDFKETIISGTYFQGCSFYDSPFTGASIVDLTFDKCELQSIIFKSNRITGDISFKDCTIDSCEIRNKYSESGRINLDECKLTHVEISECNLTGSEWVNSKIRASFINECTFTDVLFNSLVIAWVTMDNCFFSNTVQECVQYISSSMNKSSFDSGCEFKEVYFQDTFLDKSTIIPPHLAVLIEISPDTDKLNTIPPADMTTSKEINKALGCSSGRIIPLPAPKDITHSHYNTPSHYHYRDTNKYKHGDLQAYRFTTLEV